MSKEKLDIQQQINHMKSKGIRFEIEDEDFAMSYLENNTYYFKLKSYAKLFDKYSSGENKGKYVNLEFAYLRDLATIDSLLRKKILCMSLDVEHYLKVSLLRDFNKTREDGYEIIHFLKLSDSSSFFNDIDNNKPNKYCQDLVKKYENNFAIWNIVEIMSFHQFTELYRNFYFRNAHLFCKRKGKQEYYYGPYYYLIRPVRFLRNASAHNNCLLLGLKKDNNNREYKLCEFLGCNGINGRNLDRQLEKTVIHDFCVLMYLYYLVAPKEARKHAFEDLKELFESRIIKHKEYYVGNALLESSYDFIMKVINIFLKL